MTTLEMLNEAEKTNKTYICGNAMTSMRYSTSMGFHDEGGEKWNGSAFYYINDIFDINTWRLLEPKKMTLEEIENKLGYEIELVACHNCV